MLVNRRDADYGRGQHAVPLRLPVQGAVPRLNFVVAGGTRLGSVGGWQAVVLMNSLTLPLALALQTVAATQRKDRRD